ncbi:MAG TPA: chemotaxis protein CheB [Bryobacteraceae bacterium]|nr:chemotaxis protein CheB [Bryobacteraceae bacterium]
MKNATRKSGKPSSKRKVAKPARKAPAGAVASAVPSKPVAIVGIGASAGGLEAFIQLLRALPPNTGMAFVFVQHLEARHESMLTKILATATEMPIAEVVQGTVVEPNHVYVIPPNADIRVAGGVLQVARRKASVGRHLPVDLLFRSLAEDQGARAIGVILSGTASDGTLGLRAIKVEGGVTFAQDPDTAKFDGMPTSAISAGCVDFVLPPERIAVELAQIGRHPYVGLAHVRDVVPALDEEWLRVFRLLRIASGVDFTFYKKSTIQRRIARRMALHKIEQLSKYIQYLESDREELNALYQDILIHVTSFFREPEVFRAFQRNILPRVLAAKPAGEQIRMWSAGCSTGEETYSLAICLLEYLGRRASSTPIQIFGTDVSEQATEKARAGIYPANAITQVSADLLRKYFTKVDGRYQIHSSVRDLCVFARHDLTKDPPFSRLDIVSCRNVLIYLEPVLQKKVLASFHYALRDSGALLLGKSETLGGFPDLFAVVDRKNKVFSKRGASRIAYEIGPAAFERLMPQEKRAPERAPSFDLEREADRAVWERYAHAGLVVSSDLQILHFRGDTSAYLRPAPGKATFQLLRMLRDELVFELRAAIHKARRTGDIVRREQIRINHNGSSREVSVEVRPLAGPGAQEKYFLILFEETGRTEEPLVKAQKRTKGQDRELLKLKTELARTKEYLQSVIQEQESTNEELKTANEEALSSMEELQSANEELETAKEELQSSNEELVTLNEQLQNRNTELTQLGDDLNNVLSGVNIPILMLDRDHRIRRFTPTAEKLLHLLAGDIGRPLGDIRLGLIIPGLDDLISTVMDNGGDHEQEVQAESGSWFSVRLRPYRTRDRVINGVLIAFVDIRELKQTQDVADKEANLVTAILDAAAGDLLVLVMDPEARILRFNRACQELTGYTQEEVEGKRVWDFLLAPGEVAGAKVTFEDIRGGAPNRREDNWVTKDGRKRLIAWSSSKVVRNNSLEYVVATGIDLTERQEAKEEAQEKEATVQALLESAAQAILAHDREGRIVLVNASAATMFGYSRQGLLQMSVESLLPGNLREQHARQRRGWSAAPQNRPMGNGLELSGRRKDGSDFPVEVTLSHIETKDGPLGVSIISDITERKKARAALLKSQEELRDLAGRLLLIQETETKLIARDLHDDLSQKLAALGMQASSLAKAPPEPPDVLNERIRDLGQKIGGLSEDVHRMSRRLHPAILDDLGLEAALREECLSFSQRCGIAVQFQANEVPRALPSDVALCLFRVAQEALRNIEKHSNAGEVHMVLARHGPEVALVIEDRGDGFQVAEARGRGGLGLISMEERVRLVNGEFSIRSEPGKGTEIEVHVPLGSQPK